MSKVVIAHKRQIRDINLSFTDRKVQTLNPYIMLLGNALVLGYFSFVKYSLNTKCWAPCYMGNKMATKRQLLPPGAYTLAEKAMKEAVRGSDL